LSSIRHVLLVWPLAALLAACDANREPAGRNEPMHLVPLSPYCAESASPAGAHRSDYFLVERGHRADPGFRAALRRLVESAREGDISRYALYSVYVYERSERLNESFRGSADDLRGVYDGDLLGYARWHEGELDVFYLIESGRVVYDLLKDEPVSPAWEFD
jgi:hypothetical protein